MLKLLIAIFVSAMLFTTEAQWFGEIHTNKAVYSPSDTVVFHLTFNKAAESSSKIKVRYLHLAEETGSAEFDISEVKDNMLTWRWVTPENDYKGYLVEVFLLNNNEKADQKNIAVDVSSSWSVFPRYGFISVFSDLSNEQVETVISKLNRYHMNGLQFYDWHYKHHMPLKGTVSNPAATWNDIANRTIYLSTINKYITSAHSKGMKAMAYNLLYGAFSDGYIDGVKDEWGLYMDASRTKRYMYDLPSGWASDLYFMNPSDYNWRAYIYAQMKKVFEAIPFDGWHVDQVGDPGVVYDYSGNKVTVKDGFRSFLEQACDYLNVPLVLNAVNQYGAQGIAEAPVDFLYSEVWPPNNTYADIVKIINNNSSYSDNKKKTVLAAYMNYDLANNKGTFNTPGVLLTEAVIFAAGGAHIELGEHMLGKEYFPNNNLSMPEVLQNSLINYYDFLTAYENILRDSISYIPLTVSSGKYRISSTQQTGSIWQFAKEKGNKNIIHMINLVNANSLNWNDAAGTQSEPELLTDIPVSVTASSKVKKIWMASPDKNMGSVEIITFAQEGDKLTFVVPQLKYWNMLVIEYDTETSIIEESTSPSYNLEQNYPNPFNPSTNITFSIGKDSPVTLKLFSILGDEIVTLVNEELPAGYYSLPFSSEEYSLSSGVYIYSMSASGFTSTKKCVLAR